VNIPFAQLEVQAHVEKNTCLFMAFKNEGK